MGQDRPLVAGALNRVERRDAKGKTTAYWLLTLKGAGKTRSVYVPKDLVKEVQSWIRNHRRLKELMSGYLTNFRVDRDNVLEIAEGERKRWTIENQGFNEQKTGYELEHFCDCSSFGVMFVLYLLLQLAHAFMQLLARSNLIDPVGTLTFLAHLLLEALRNTPVTEDLFDTNAAPFQVRLNREPT